jgi:hypothetical protein
LFSSSSSSFLSLLHATNPSPSHGRQTIAECEQTPSS